MSLRHRWRWMVLAYFFPAMFMGLAGAAHVALGGTLLRSPVAGHILLAVVNFPLVFLVGGPLGEELRWRGYALPLMQDRLGWRDASLVLGCVWAFWQGATRDLWNTALTVHSLICRSNVSSVSPELDI